jgi:hypothetical protein
LRDVCQWSRYLLEKTADAKGTFAALSAVDPVDVSSVTESTEPNIVDSMFLTRVDAKERYLYDGIFYAQNKLVYEAYNDFWKTETAKRSYDGENYNIKCDAENTLVNKDEKLQMTEFILHDKTRQCSEDRLAQYDTFKGVALMNVPISVPSNKKLKDVEAAGGTIARPKIQRCKDLCNDTANLHTVNMVLAIVLFGFCIVYTYSSRNEDTPTPGLVVVSVMLLLLTCASIAVMDFGAPKDMGNCLFEDVQTYIKPGRDLFVGDVGDSHTLHQSLPIAIAVLLWFSVAFHASWIGWQVCSGPTGKTAYMTATELFVESGF